MKENKNVDFLYTLGWVIKNCQVGKTWKVCGNAPLGKSAENTVKWLVIIFLVKPLAFVKKRKKDLRKLHKGKHNDRNPEQRQTDKGSKPSSHFPQRK